MAFITRHRSKAMRNSKRAIIGIMMYDRMVIVKDDGYKIERGNWAISKEWTT